MHKMLKRLKSKKGFSYPAIAIFMLIFLIFITGIFEVLRVQSLVSTARDKFISAIINASTENYKNVFPTTREGYAAGTRYNNFTWESCNSTAQNTIRNAIVNELTKGEKYQIKVKNIDFVVSPQGIGSNVTQTFSVKGSMVVSIPFAMSFAGLPPMNIKINVVSSWRAAF